MPTWTSNVTNVPNVQQKQQDFQNLMGSINQFAGVMYNIQQAKQAELVKNITVTSSVITHMPKNLQPEATKNILFPLINKAMPGVFKPESFDFSKIVDLPKYIQGMDKFKNDPVGLQKYTAAGVNLFTTDEYKALEETKKSILEANKQAKINELTGIAGGVIPGRNLPTSIPSQIAQGLYQVPETQKFTEYTPQEQKQANIDLSAIAPTIAEKFFQKTGILPTKETGGKWYVNADTGERKAFYPGDKMEGNWYELGAKPAEKTPTDYGTFYKAGKDAGLTDAQISKNWEVQKIEIAKLSRQPRETIPEAVAKTVAKEVAIRNLPEKPLTPEQKRLIAREVTTLRTEILKDKSNEDFVGKVDRLNEIRTDGKITVWSDKRGEWDEVFRSKSQPAVNSLSNKTVTIDGKQYKEGDIIIKNGQKFKVRLK